MHDIQTLLCYECHETLNLLEQLDWSTIELTYRCRKHSPTEIWIWKMILLIQVCLDTNAVSLKPHHHFFINNHSVRENSGKLYLCNWSTVYDDICIRRVQSAQIISHLLASCCARLRSQGSDDATHTRCEWSWPARPDVSTLWLWSYNLSCSDQNRMQHQSESFSIWDKSYLTIPG